jgi:glutamyl-tRNA reductase
MAAEPARRRWRIPGFGRGGAPVAVAAPPPLPAPTAAELVAVGLSHHTAPVALREQFALDDGAVVEELAALRAEGLVREALLLSTCNRVELYAVPAAGRGEGLRARFRGRAGRPDPGLDRHLYWLRGADVVRHLFRVAASLDSLVVGEPQILGQVKAAVRLADEAHTLGAVLHPLSRRTLEVAKRVRSTTDIGRFRVGIGNAGVHLARQIFTDLSGRRAMLVGVGEMGRQVAKAMLGEGVGELLVANRTFERSMELAAESGGTAIPFERMPTYLARVDIVITATGASRPILGVPEVRAALRERRHRPLFLVDLSVPRNIDPAVDQLDDAFLFNIDDLRQVMDEGRAARDAASQTASALVEQATAGFMSRLAVIGVNEGLGALAQLGEAARQQELARSAKLVAQLDEAGAAQLDAMTRALVKRVLHGPLTTLRAAAAAGDTERVRALLSAWGLGEDEGSDEGGDGG